MKFSRILKCTAAAAVCALTLSGCENYNKMMDEQPQEYINIATENTTEAMVKSAFADEAAIIEKALADGTVGLSFDIQGIKFKGEAYANEKKKESSQLYTIEMGGEKLDIYAAITENTLKLGEIGDSGEHIFEINLDSLEDDLDDSIFAPGSGSSMEIPEEEYKMIAEYLGQITAALNGEEEDLPESYKELEEVINDLLSEADVEKKTNVEIDGKEVKANVITYNFDKNDIKKIYEVYMDVMLEEMASQDEEVINDMKEEFNSAFDAIEKMDMELVYYVNSKSHCLMQMDCNVDVTIVEYEESQSAKAEIVMVYGADPAKAEETTIEAKIEADGEEVEVEIVTERKSENETEVAVNASMQGMNMEIVTLKFERDGDDYTIEAEIPVIEAKATVKGELKTEGKSVEATVDKVSYAVASEGIEGSLEDFNIKFSIEQGGKFDDRDAKNFFKLSEEELMTEVEEIGNDFNVLLENVGTDNFLGDSMTSYIGESKIASANASAKTVYTAFAAALTQMGISGVEFDEYEFYNEASGDLNIVVDGYDLGLVDYLGDSFTGYFYVSVDPYTYAVNFALWSEEPIDYFYQYSDYDQEYYAEEGQYIGCYPLYTY